MNNGDILLWPDGFWCFVDELRADMLRDEEFQILTEGSPEWTKVSSRPAIPPA
jgi:hypothetical protein